jgi:hypothetical protein
VRSSWAASATKCCCASKAVRTRPNSRFSSCTSGRTSSGSPASDTGDKSSAWREATCFRTRATGSSEPLTTHHTTSIRIGIITAIGPSVRKARLPAMLRRTARSWATCTVWLFGLDREDAVGRTVGAHVGKAQHRALRQARVRDAAEYLHAIRRPHLHHQVVVAGDRAVSRIALVDSSVFAIGTRERSDNAICCMW